MQEFPSSHAVLFGSVGFVQMPVLGLHVPRLWHLSGAGQAPGAQAPVADEHVVHPEHAFPVFCQAPFASQVCGWAPLHCFVPSAQAPEQAPVAVLQTYGQAFPLFCQAPLALQICG